MRWKNYVLQYVSLIVPVAIIFLVLNSHWSCIGNRIKSPLEIERLPTLDQKTELKKWRSAILTSKENRYTPPLFQEPISEEQKREAIRQFYVFREDRDSVLAGFASKDTKRRYYQAVINDLKQRGEVMEYLEKNYERTKSLWNKQSSLQRTSQFAKIKILQVKYEQLANAAVYSTEQHIPIDKTPRRQKVFCFADSYGFVTCLPEQRLTDMFMRGHWAAPGKWITDSFDEGIAYDIIHQLDSILSQLGLDPAKNTKVLCFNGINTAWMTLDTQGPQLLELLQMPGLPDLQTQNSNLPSVAEMAGMAQGCKALLGTQRITTPGSGDVSDGSNSEWAQEQINEIDEEVNNCVEESNGTISIGWLTPLFDFLGLPTTRMAIYGILFKMGVIDGISDSPEKSPTVREAWEKAYQAGKDFSEANEELVVAKMELDKAVREYKEADYQAWVTDIEADKAFQDAEADPSNQQKQQKAKEATLKAYDAAVQREEARKKLEAAEAKKEKAEEKRDEAKKKLDEEEERYNNAKDREEQPKGALPDEIGGGACERHKAWWEWFKYSCRGQWDARGSECNMLLRRHAGCFDNPLVSMPNPEGGFDRCSHPKLNKLKAWEEFCKRKQGLMSQLEPTNINCALFIKSSLSDFEYSICNDPASIMTEDQWARNCGQSQIPGIGHPGAQGTGHPQPKPIGNLIISDGVQILDRTGMQGLGIQGLEYLFGTDKPQK